LPEQRVFLAEMNEEDIPFLYQLWGIEQVNRYADEFPRLRGWSKKSDIPTAWRLYQEHRQQFGAAYQQLILRLKEGTAIGESFYGPLPEGIVFGAWRKPAGLKYLLGDIKLRPEYWGQGYGAEAMRAVVSYVFEQTACDAFIVPPHQNNPAATRVYEKAGFIHTGVVVWGGHELLEMTRTFFHQAQIP
jgi:RimJ/RimL family protein N-acetyltransferase